MRYWAWCSLRLVSRSRLVRDVLLRNGSTLRLQTPTPGDFEDLKEFFDRLSAESRYLLPRQRAERGRGSCGGAGGRC